MEVRVNRFDRNIVSEYSAIPIAFEVSSVLRAEPVEDGLGGISLTEVPLESTYQKDYDSFPDERPSAWLDRWDTSQWACIIATGESEVLGGAVVAWDTPAFSMLEGRRDISVLCDMRVHPQARGRGIGRKLFREAAEWSRSQGCRQMKIETQNTNVAACRFYIKMGCTLGAINRFAYYGEQVAEEIQLIWCLNLGPVYFVNTVPLT